MQDRNTQMVRSPQGPVHRTDDPSRLLPLAIAGVFCFLTAVMLGTLSWYFLWLPFESSASAAAEPVQSYAVAESPEPQPAAEAPAAAPEPEPVVESAPPQPPQGSVFVAGGEIALAGDANRPLERVILDGFAIGETEVTNAEYSEFIRETGHPSPHGWSGPRFPDGTDSFPVVNVSWRDAAAFCEWKGRKLGMPVRLPTEAEWELAARGPEQRKYPWGEEWNAEAAASKESGGAVSAVKSFALNRSSAGAYDMVGNVWEWLADEIAENEAVSDDQAESARKQGRRLRIVKGGSAEEPSKDLDARSRYEVPENTKVKVIGFRYVVELKKQS